MGFASSPGWLRLLGLVPEVGGVIFAVASIWMVVAAVVAVKKALNYTSTQRGLLDRQYALPGVAIYHVLLGIRYLAIVDPARITNKRE